MTQYGLIDVDYPYTTEIPWKLPRGHVVYQTELKPDVLDILQKFGPTEANDYINNPKKFLVERDMKGIILISFPAKSGGHFLANCLSLSDSITIANYPTILDKLNYICFGYNNEIKYWNDVNITSEIDLDNSKHLFFLSHIEEDFNIKKLWDFWTQSDKVVLFKNISLFIGLRRCVYSLKSVGGYFENGILKHETLKLSENDLIDLQLERSSRNNRERNLYIILEKNKINLYNYKKLSLKIRNNLVKIFNNKKPHLRQNYSYCQLKTKKQIYFWDVNWYLDEEEFLQNVESFYIGLELSCFDKELVRKCYRCWMNAMYRCLSNTLNI